MGEPATRLRRLLGIVSRGVLSIQKYRRVCRILLVLIWKVRHVTVEGVQYLFLSCQAPGNQATVVGVHYLLVDGCLACRGESCHRGGGTIPFFVGFLA